MAVSSVAALGIATLAAGCGASPAASTTQAPKVIKVGFLVPETGTAAASGLDMIHGWQLWWKQHGTKVDGYKVETIYYDTASNPQTAATQARKAVEQDHVQMIVGPYLASSGLAVAPYLEQQKIPFFPQTVSADELTQQKRSPYLIRVAGWTSSQTTFPAGPWMYQQGYHNVVTIGSDYAFGYEVVGGFAQTYTAAGGKILKQIWTPLGTTNYAPYLSDVQLAHPQAVFVEMVGADAGRFLEQWHAFGLAGKIKLIGNETLTDQSNIRAVPTQDVLGITTFAHFAEGRQNAATQTFNQQFSQAYKELPSYMAAASYTEAEWLNTAFQKVHGNVTDKKAFLAAVRGVSFKNTPLGPMKLDAYGNPIENVYIRTVEKTPTNYQGVAKIWNVPVHTYPNVSQFWTFSPSKFLKQPDYSTTFQGISN